MIIARLLLIAEKLEFSSLARTSSTVVTNRLDVIYKSERITQEVNPCHEVVYPLER